MQFGINEIILFISLFSIGFIIGYVGRFKEKIIKLTMGMN